MTKIMMINNSEITYPALTTTAHFEERLWTTARLDTADANFEFTFPCATVVRDLIRAGALNMQRENRFTPSDIEEAEENWSLFLQAMIKEAVQNSAIGDKNPLLKKKPLRENAFVKAKHTCPSWPFC